MGAFLVAGGDGAEALEAVLRFLYRSLSKPVGRPPREPRFLRCLCWSRRSGMVWRIPRRRR